MGVTVIVINSQGMKSGTLENGINVSNAAT